VALLKGEPGSHDGFMLASETLQRRDRKLTENERFLVQEMIFRLSVKCSIGPPPIQFSSLPQKKTVYALLTEGVSSSTWLRGMAREAGWVVAKVNNRF
jgi:hypothetical protein